MEIRPELQAIKVARAGYCISFVVKMRLCRLEIRIVPLFARVAHAVFQIDVECESLHHLIVNSNGDWRRIWIARDEIDVRVNRRTLSVRVCRGYVRGVPILQSAISVNHFGLRFAAETAPLVPVLRRIMKRIRCHAYTDSILFQRLIFISVSEKVLP